MRVLLVREISLTKASCAHDGVAGSVCAIVAGDSILVNSRNAREMNIDIGLLDPKAYPVRHFGSMHLARFTHATMNGSPGVTRRQPGLQLGMIFSYSSSSLIHSRVRCVKVFVKDRISSNP